MYKEKYEAEKNARALLEGEVIQLRGDMQRMEAELKRLRGEKRQVPAAIDNRKSAIANPPTPGTQHLAPSPDLNGFYESFKSRLLRDAAVLSVLAARPEIEVKVDRPTIQLDGQSLKGRVALLITQGFLDGAKSNTEIFRECRRQFNIANPSAPRLNEAVSDLHTMGFLWRDDSGGYQAVEGMKVRIVEN